MPAQFTIRILSIFHLTEGTSELESMRRISGTTDPTAEITIDEYITACYGTTEYPEDLTGITLTLQGAARRESIDYAYQCREAAVPGIITAEAVVPQVDTCLTMRTDTDRATGYFREGFAFSPMYTVDIKRTLQGKGNCARGSR